MLRVILASQSPRRRQLLTMIGIEHTVVPADIDETYPTGEPPAAHAERLAREKAGTIALRCPDSVVIGADTIVVIDSRVLGKPRDVADAERMLGELSGRTHVVHTGVAVSHGGRVVSGVASVAVTFRALTSADITAYVATGEPMDKAGAYGIQGYGATIVDRIDGDYFAVMGLALNQLVHLLARVGIRYEFDRLLDEGLPDE
ncbi:MAG: Maf family protein [Gemmatimonadaceae bacterium]